MGRSCSWPTELVPRQESDLITVGVVGRTGLTFPSLTKAIPAPALRLAMRASITDVSATLRSQLVLKYAE